MFCQHSLINQWDTRWFVYVAVSEERCQRIANQNWWWHTVGDDAGANSGKGSVSNDSTLTTMLYVQWWNAVSRKLELSMMIWDALSYTERGMYDIRMTLNSYAWVD